MKINYDELISVGYDAYDWKTFYMRRYHGRSYITHSDPDLYEAYHMMERAERVLTAVCYVLEIPSDIPVKAVRIINRVYDLAYEQGRDPGTVDNERLIKSLLANQ